MKSVKDLVIVITGASSGIGKASALRFARSGANVVLAARRKDLLKDLANDCERLGVETLVVETDVTSEKDVRKLCDAAISKFDRIDIWINNAGVATFGRYDEVPLNEHVRVIETNLLGTMYGSYYAMQQFREQGFGNLINVSSYDGRGSAPYHASYVASKHGVRGLGMSLRQELWANNEKNISVCTVMPVSIDTPFFQHAANHMGKPVLPIPPVYPVQEAADTLFKLALDPQDESMVGRAGKFFGLQGKFAPKLTEKQMAWQTHRTEMGQKRGAADTSGSLFKPVKSGTGKSGGWLDRESSQDLPRENGRKVEERSNGMFAHQNGNTGKKIAAGVTLAAAPAVLGWWLFKRGNLRRELEYNHFDFTSPHAQSPENQHAV
jgi:short-subunit dehydrogenase